MDTSVVYRAPPTVARFLKSDAFFRCIVGPFGSGKSSGCCLELVRRAKQQKQWKGARRTRFAVIRNTYSQLRDTTRKTFEQWVPSQLGRWHEQSFTFTMKFGDVHSEILFRALDRPEDVKKLLSLELTGAYVNEMREVPKAVVDGVQGRVGRYPAKKDGGPSWSGVWSDTNPWHTGHWGHKLFRAKPAGHEFYRQPSGFSGEAENLENLPDGYYVRMAAGKDSEWVRVYCEGLDGTSDVGSVYGQVLDGLEERGGVSDFVHPSDGLFTNWDLGLGDATAFWVWRLNGKYVEVVDHYENHGEGLEHYFAEIERREAQGWRFVKHWLPHDARQKTLAAGVSVLNRFLDRFGAGKVAIGPDLSIIDGLQAVRWLLEQPGTRFHARCEHGLEALREYRYEWDEENRCFSKRPIHNWASHTADAFRYVACVVNASELLTRKAVEEEGPIARPYNSFTWNEMFDPANIRPKPKERI